MHLFFQGNQPNPEESNQKCEKLENTSHEILIKNVTKSDEKCKKYFCIYCKKLICKFARHLEVKYKDVQEVIKFSLLPRGKNMLLLISNTYLKV